MSLGVTAAAVTFRLRFIDTPSPCSRGRGGHAPVHETDHRSHDRELEEEERFLGRDERSNGPDVELSGLGDTP